MVRKHNFTVYFGGLVEQVIESLVTNMYFSMMLTPLTFSVPHINISAALAEVCPLFRAAQIHSLPQYSINTVFKMSPYVHA